MENRSISTLSSLCAVLGLLSACGGSPQEGHGHGHGGGPAEFPVAVLAPQSVRLHADYPVTLQGLQEVELRPKVNGFIGEILVEEGQQVGKGQLLFRIFAPEHQEEQNRAAAAVQSLEAELSEARLQVEKTRPLVDEGVVGKYELESALNLLAAKEAQLAQARAVWQAAKANAGYTEVRAPFGGVMGLIPYKVGSLVSSASQEPISHLADVSSVRVYFSMNEKRFLDFLDKADGLSPQKYFAERAEVELVLPNGKTFAEPGRIDMVNGLVDSRTGSIALRAVFPNRGSVLRSGNSAVLRMYETLDGAVLVPQNATFEMQGRRFVYKVDEGGTVSSAAISVMDRTPSARHFVVAEGAVPGDRIVTEGLAGLSEGMKISPKTKTTEN